MGHVSIIAEKLQAAGVGPNEAAIIITPKQDAEDAAELNNRQSVFLSLVNADLSLNKIVTMQCARFLGYLIIVKEST